MCTYLKVEQEARANHTEPLETHMEMLCNVKCELMYLSNPLVIRSHKMCVNAK